MKAIKKPVLLIISAALCALNISCGGTSDKKSAGNKIYEVKKGDLAIEITEQGNLVSTKSFNLAFEVDAYPMTLAWIIPEGTKVKKGDILAKLEKSEMEKNIMTMTSNIEVSKKNLTIAEEDLKIQKSSNDIEIKAKQNALNDSLTNLRVYTEMEGPRQLRDLESAVNKAKAEVESSEKQLKTTQDEGDQSIFMEEKEKKELDKKIKQAKSDYESKKTAYDSANINYKKFKNYDYPSKINSLKTAYSYAKYDFDRAKSQANSRVIQKENEILRYKNDNEMQQRNLDKTNVNLTKMEIIAPIDGIVSYNRDRYRGGEEVTVGKQLWRGNAFLTIPYLAEYKVTLQIGERDRNKIKAGDKASIKIEAIPELSLKGEIKYISPLATPITPWDPSSPKAFQVDVLIQGSDDRMQPGMSATVKITSETIRNVLSVPVEAIYEKTGKYYCYIENTKGQPEEREIKVGKSNNDFIIVKENLKEKEKIYLYSPFKKK